MHGNKARRFRRQQQGLGKDGKEDPYDADKVQKAALAYSKIAGPEKSQAQRIKEAEEKVKEAKNSAETHSAEWAKMQNVKTAKNLKETANDACHREQHKYEKVKYRVKKRLGMASESDHKTLMKGEYKSKQWAERKVEVMVGNGKKLTESSEKKKTQLTQREQREDLQAERKEKHDITQWKEKARKYDQSARERQGAAQLGLKMDAASQSVKIHEAEQVLIVSRTAYETEASTSLQKLEAGKKRLQDEARKEYQELATRRTHAMELLMKSSSHGGKVGVERAEKQSKDLLQANANNHKELIEKATRKRDEEIKDIDTKTKEKREDHKQLLVEAKGNAQKSLATAKEVV